MYNYNNTDIKAWHASNFSNLKSSIFNKGIRHRIRGGSAVSLAASLTKKLRTSKGMVTRLSYGFSRTGVWAHKGVGRDTPIVLAGFTNRKAKPWYDDVLNKNLPDLQQIVAGQDATFVINNLTIK